MSEFNKKAKGWDLDPKKRERAKQVAAAIKKNIPLKSSMRAMEYGCGTGLVGFCLKNDLFHITLADNSQKMLDVLKKKIEFSKATNLSPLFLDLPADKAPEEKFDLIFISMTLHHIPETDLILKLFYSMLSESGYLCIADLEKEDGSFHGKDFKGHTGFERESLKKQALSAGFKRVFFSPCYIMEKNRNGTIKKYPMFLMSCEKSAQCC